MIPNKYIVLFFAYLLVTWCLRAQPEKSYLEKDIFLGRLNELRTEFGQGKMIPPEIEIECLSALSFYPELKNVQIEFRFASLNSTMSSKPTLNSIFKKSRKRKYIITIQKPDHPKTNFEWRSLSFNSIVGWIGHELGHIVHYFHKTGGGILFTGIKYFIPGYRRRMERFTDEVAIHHDLGFALYEGSDYVINHSNATGKYIRKLKRFYLSPEEIIERIHSQQSWIAIYRKTKMNK